MQVTTLAAPSATQTLDQRILSDCITRCQMHTQASYGRKQKALGNLNRIAEDIYKSETRRSWAESKETWTLSSIGNVLEFLLVMQASNVMPHIDELVQLPSCQHIESRA